MRTRTNRQQSGSAHPKVWHPRPQLPLLASHSIAHGTWPRAGWLCCARVPLPSFDEELDEQVRGTYCPSSSRKRQQAEPSGPFGVRAGGDKGKAPAKRGPRKKAGQAAKDAVRSASKARRAERAGAAAAEGGGGESAGRQRPDKEIGDEEGTDDDAEELDDPIDDLKVRACSACLPGLFFRVIACFITLKCSRCCTSTCVGHAVRSMKAGLGKVF